MTSREAAEALVRAFTTDDRPNGDTTQNIYVSSWGEMSVLSDWLKHYAHKRLSDEADAMLFDHIDPVDQEWVVSELVKHCEASIREDLHDRLGWSVVKDET